MKPISSARGMNVLGAMRPFCGWCQRIRASKALISLVAEIDDRLVVELELAGGQRPAQIDLHAAPLLHLRIHGRLEEAKGAAAILLGPVQRQVGVAHEHVGVQPIAGADGDADAGADVHLLAVDVVGQAHQFDHAARERSGIGRLGDAGLQNGELVAAHARDDVGVPRQRAQPFGDHLEELVAGGMAQRIVDGLEVVEIEEVSRDVFAALGPGEGLLEVLVEQDPVGQAGQRIMMGHVRDLGLGAALLGDVLMRGDRAAVGHRPHGDGDAAAVAELAVEVAETGLSPPQHAAHDVVGRHFRREAVGDAIFDDLLKSGAGLHLRRRKPIDLGVAAVGQHEPVLGIEHRQALDDVVQRRIELVVLRAKLLFFQLQQFVLLLELGEEPLPFALAVVELDQRRLCLGSCTGGLVEMEARGIESFGIVGSMRGM